MVVGVVVVGGGGGGGGCNCHILFEFQTAKSLI